MQPRSYRRLLASTLLFLFPLGLCAQTHPAMRPLPQPAPGDRPLPEGPAYYVDGETGDDSNTGTREEPWQSIQHGVGQLKPGDHLVVREGIYYEAVEIEGVLGTPEQPITLSAHPGELVIIDAGHRQFLEDPAGSWEPCPESGEGVYRSTALYPDLAGDRTTFRGMRFAVAHFADTMNPLQVYKWKEDLETDNAFLRSVQGQANPVYMGPGTWVDPETGRLLIRLAHLAVEAWGDTAYAGPTDPRHVPMVVGGVESPMRLHQSGHIHLRDLVLRGSRNNTLSVRHSSDLVFDGVTVHSGGVTTVSFVNSPRVIIRNSVFRGASTPWSSRVSHKFRGSYPSLIVFTNYGGESLNAEYTIVDSEFTDGYSALRSIGRVDGFRFERNLVDNFCYITFDLSTDHAHENDQRITGNRIERCLTVFFASNDPIPGDRPVLIAGNVINLRDPVLWPARETDEQRPHLLNGNLWHETRAYRNRPIARPLNFQHNTIILREPLPSGGYGGLGRPAGDGPAVMLFNNIFVYLRGEPGIKHVPGPADGNLHWSYDSEEAWSPASLKGQGRRDHELESLIGDVAGDGPDHFLGMNDLIAEPGFRQPINKSSSPADLRLIPGSPAIGTAVPIPTGAQELLTGGPTASLDIGAIPHRTDASLPIGAFGRHTLFSLQKPDYLDNPSSPNLPQ